MAIFRPEVKSNNGANKFLGICEFGIVDFRDRTNEFDWADLYIEVEIKQKFSEYTRNLQIKGSFDMEGDKIVGGSVLKRLYHLFDVIGCTAGLDVNGKWEDEKGDKIENIQKYLCTNFIKPGNTETYEPPFDYIAYIYKEKPKKDGDKAWIVVNPKIFTNTEDNKVRLKEYIIWLKGKGYVKEATDITPTQSTMTGNSLSNL